ncbi:hypothetical protein GCM10023200_58490 [Actinomycetospora chlora]|uniref:Uncharacterized protein n=1 Tax=Actinomycetospora chlora TaxID=663608 RepID=A0ABP9CQH5_9PSEU
MRWPPACVARGSPSPATATPGWPPYSAGTPTTRLFGVGEQAADALTDAPDGPEQEVWEGVR